MKRLRIQYFSDCPFFAGSENMLTNFFNDDAFMAKHDVGFAFRENPVYEEGFRKRVTREFDVQKLPLHDIEVTHAKIATIRNPLLSKGLKTATQVSMLRYGMTISNTAQLTEAWKGKDIDVLHINNGGYPGARSCMSAVFAARLLGIRNVVYVVNNIAVPYASISRKLDYPWDKQVFQGVSTFVTGSRYAQRALIQNLGLDESKTRSIPNGIARRTPKYSPEEVRERLGVPAGRRLLGVVALFEKRKGHIYLLEALKNLKGEANLPYLVCMGTGPEEETLRAFVRDNGMEKDVLLVRDDDPQYAWLTQNRNVFSFIHASDWIALPSISNEDFPNVVLEAMSLSKPVIASSFSGIPEQIDSGVTGILVQPKDVAGLVQGLKDLMLHPEKTPVMGAAAKAKFDRMFSAEVSIRNYENLYEGLVSRQRN